MRYMFLVLTRSLFEGRVFRFWVCIRRAGSVVIRGSRINGFRGSKTIGKMGFSGYSNSTGSGDFSVLLPVYNTISAVIAFNFCECCERAT